MLFSLSDEKQAPKFLSKLNEKSKLPLRALVTTYILIVAIIIIANFYSNAVFSLLNIIGSLVIIVWAASSWAQVRLRKAIKRQDKISINFYLINHHCTSWTNFSICNFNFLILW